MAQAPVQTYQNLTAENATFYDRTLLERLVPNLVWLKYGQKRTMPKNSGGQVSFRRFNSLSVNTTPLTEGVTPDGKSLDVTNLTAQVQEYGDFVKISSKLNLLGIDPVLTETANVLGEQAALTLDTLAMREVSNGTNVQFPKTTITDIDDIAKTDVITSELIQKAVRTLRNANAKPMDSGYFYGFINHNVAYDLQRDPLWQDVSKYNGGTNIEKGEIGRLHGVRFIDTTNTQTLTNANNVDVHSTVIVAKDAYGCIDLEGELTAPKVIIKDAGSSGSADPLEQRASAGWKALMAVKRLNEMAIVRIETAATV